MMTCEGTIEIELSEFNRWLSTHHANMGEVFYGVPRVNIKNGTLEVDFAAGSDESPEDWAKKPKAVQQWDDQPD